MAPFVSERFDGIRATVVCTIVRNTQSFHFLPFLGINAEEEERSEEAKKHAAETVSTTINQAGIFQPRNIYRRARPTAFLNYPPPGQGEGEGESTTRK